MLTSLFIFMIMSWVVVVPACIEIQDTEELFEQKQSGDFVREGEL